MNPTLPEIIRGQAVVLATPLPPEAGGDYQASRLGMLSTLAVLAAYEAEHGTQARVWENAAMRAMFAKAAGAYSLDGALAKAASDTDTDFTWTGLDASNAALRRLLIALHEAVEAADDAATDHAIIALYQGMAHARRLELGG